MIIIKGSCNRCGDCCKPPVMVENPCIDKGEDRCKFYTDQLNTYLYGHCLIHGRGTKPLKNVKDRFGKTITDAQIKWFEQNCIDYPSAEDIEKGHILPSGCGFKVEVIS